LGRVQGLEALDAGEFDKAKLLLSRAARAVDALGGEFQGADAIRQGAKEAAIYTDLAPKSLEDILDEAANFRSAEEWPARFDSHYKGRSVVVEAYIASTPKAGSGSYDLDYRILAPGSTGKPRVGRIDLADFALFSDSKPSQDDRVLFGARLASFGLDERGDWVARLEPRSGVILVHPKALEALNWPTGEAGEEGVSP
jgi:hypothetical protein